MAVTITPEELYFGAPTTLTYGGTDVGGTTEAPRIVIEPTYLTPDFQNAGGPVEGTKVVTGCNVRAEIMVNQLVAAKLIWALPGAENTAGTITWTIGRVPSTAYKDLVLVGPGLDGRTLTATIENACPESSIELPFGKEEFTGMSLTFIGHYDSTTPLDVPFSLAFAGGS
jgi:hypothetical protein